MGLPGPKVEMGRPILKVERDRPGPKVETRPFLTESRDRAVFYRRSRQVVSGWRSRQVSLDDSSWSFGLHTNCWLYAQ